MRKYRLDDEGILELTAVVDTFGGFNKLMDGLQVEPDGKAGTGEERHRQPPLSDSLVTDGRCRRLRVSNSPRPSDP